MNRIASIYFYLFVVFITSAIILTATGCANIIPPGGGPRDSLPPVLISAVPKDSATNFSGNRISINFDEYIELQNVFENVIVSPTPTNAPIINYNFRTVSIRIKDTLEPNTTYSINFGNALRDINEGNVYKDFTYIFSTGNTIDQNSISGRVIMAETGAIDSTLIVILQKNLDDSAVVKDKPRYIARLDGKGNFKFENLAAGTFALYALPNDYSKKYDDTTKPFAFADSAINTTQNTPVTLYAYSLPKKDTATKKGSTTENEERGNRETKIIPRLRYQTNLQNSRQDLLGSLELSFNRKITFFDSTKVYLTDTNYNRIGHVFVADTAANRFIIRNNWPAATIFSLIIDSSAFSDSTGLRLAKNDTVRFSTKRLEDYGSVKLRFTNLDLTKNPVLQIIQTDRVVDSIPLTQREWSNKMYPPGEYDLRLLLDDNKNGKWDPGHFFGLHKQPEIVIPINTRLSVRANWDNEKDIKL